ncbi:cache domain-containing sensor histidine kinase [Paenibacillus gansuensis]|uniref:histidine kinase n=1 Tax=Paenibacillus gansuensis TaxID=306542 RepID=A0ABW5PHF3_9BACL
MKMAWMQQVKQALYRNKLVYSLRSRMTAAFLLSSFITFALVSSASYYTMYSILYNKIEKGIQITLDQVTKEMDANMDNLISVSQQLSYGGVVSNDLFNFMSTDSFSSKRTHYDNITSYLNLIDFTNPNAGLHFYYNAVTEQPLFSNNKVDKGFSSRGDRLPVLTDKTLYTFYGPHKTFVDGGESMVLSLIRPVDLYGEFNLKLYLETNLNALTNTLKQNQLGMDIGYVLVNNQGGIVYSDRPADFKVGAVYEGGRPKLDDAYVFGSKSRYGWELLGTFNKSVFNQEIRSWALRMAVLGVVLMLVSLLAGYLVWRAVYKPIRLFRKEIGMISSSNFDSTPERTNIVEFDGVLKQFQSMKQNIQELLAEVQQKEFDKRQLEVDKLLSQINPHFLYNTLNTVQWMARAEGQKPIVQLVTQLTRVLRYNLGKEGSIVTVEQEVSALRDYVAIQLVRNDYQFEVQYRIDERAEGVAIPRFILQPLVENAIYHGLEEGEGTIEVSVLSTLEGTVQVSVRDNGRGLSENKMAELLEGTKERDHEVGLGIGLNYVNKMLEVHYGESCKLHMHSRKGEGTVYSFEIPDNRGELGYEKSTGS